MKSPDDFEFQNRINVYDNPKVADRYTVLYWGQPLSYGLFAARHMAERISGPDSYTSFNVARPKDRALGREILFTSLPKAHQAQVRRDLKNRP